MQGEHSTPLSREHATKSVSRAGIFVKGRGPHGALRPTSNIEHRTSNIEWEGAFGGGAERDRRGACAT